MRPPAHGGRAEVSVSPETGESGLRSPCEQGRPTPQTPVLHRSGSLSER